jgi:hypothetical protein
MTDEIPIMRVPVSLPCQVKVVPGTPVADAPLELRTEFCAVDAWWMVGLGMMCDLHLRGFLGESYATLGLPEGFEYNTLELLPWEEMPRYPQEQAEWRDRGARRG